MSEYGAAIYGTDTYASEGIAPDRTFSAGDLEAASFAAVDNVATFAAHDETTATFDASHQEGTP